MVECGAKPQSTRELTAHAQANAHTHTHPTHTRIYPRHTLIHTLAVGNLRAALIMPRNINVYPFRFSGPICHGPCRCALPSPAHVAGIAIPCLRHSTAPCLSSVSVLNSAWLWEWVVLCLCLCVLCLVPCVVPLDLTAVASAVHTAPHHPASTPPRPALISKRRRCRRRRFALTRLWHLYNRLPGGLSHCLRVSLSGCLSVYQAEAALLSQCTVGCRRLRIFGIFFMHFETICAQASQLI